jgi:serine/threonine protein kinase
MSEWLADRTLAHLRDVAEWPDLGERYEVTGRLGRGGMGVVYSARDRVLDRDVAVKVLDAFDETGARARGLLDEARILGRLEHPGIVPVHDAGTLPDGQVFYVMTLVRGERLDRALDRQRSPNERLELFLRICDAVSFAHAQGIVHRDLKPENVMLGRFGEVLVMDWGVARVMGLVAADEAVVGTPGFMAPEQARRGDQIDGRADVYALGVILRSMVVGVDSRPLAAIIAKACARELSERYASVERLARDVIGYRDGEPIEAYEESPFERLARLYSRYRVPILLVAAYVIMRMLLLVWTRA